MMKKNTTQSVQMHDITPVHEGQRLDNYLMAHLKGVPKSLIYRIIRRGEVRCNSGRVKAQTRLKAGDRLRIPPLRLPEEKPEVQLHDQAKGRLKAAILKETSDWIILNKPAGLAVHGGSGVSLGMIEQLRLLRPELDYLQLAHRLDKETSGLVVVAKKRTALKNLQAVWPSVKKTYLALVVGHWDAPGKVSAPLLRVTLKNGDRMVKVHPEGKEAQTRFVVKKRFEHTTLLEVTLDTGRMHQIRAHTAYLGFPIVGDPKYGDYAFNRKHAIKTLYLHAQRLKSDLLPEGLEAELPSYWDEFLNT